MNMNLVPVCANPKDFKSITEKMKALAVEAHKTYSEFPIADQISLSPTQRESYGLWMGEIDTVRQMAASCKIFDNTGLTSNSGLRDRNPEVNEVGGTRSNGSRVDISYDVKGSVTSYSDFSEPAKSQAPDKMFQETSEVIVCSVAQRSGNLGGILFDKTTHQGTIFKVE